jgi:hypothetical protein
MREPRSAKGLGGVNPDGAGVDVVVACSVAPQLVQNFASAGTSLPHFGQYGITLQLFGDEQRFEYMCSTFQINQCL